jgi:mannose-1-phosphate guanylyltransferase
MPQRGRFQEKPTVERASALLVAGALWNTFVLVTTAATLIEAGRECVPILHERLARIGSFASTELEPWAIRQAHALAPRANFSCSVLELCRRPLAVAKLPGLTWCDQGTPLESRESSRAARTWRRGHDALIRNSRS